jgi:hypothetical protein
MWIFLQRFALGVAKALGACMLGGGILYQVIERVSPDPCIARVHVAKARANITIDDQTFWVNTAWGTPLACKLKPGHHVVRMLEGPNVLFEDEFTLEPGQEIVLAVWDKLHGKPGACNPPNTP